MYADLDEKPWNNFLDKLLNRENFNFRREIEGAGGMVVPDWNHCLENEFHQRTRRPIRQALWAAHEDPQHRMEHWVTFLTVANSRSQSSQALMVRLPCSAKRLSLFAASARVLREDSGLRSSHSP